jgi:Zn-dependent peptidase ImmA (M78 family)
MKKAQALEKIVTELLAKHGIEKAPVPVEDIARKLGAVLRFEPFDGKDDVSAMLYRNDEHIVIGVNSGHSKTRQRFSIAHECGHLLLHKGKMYVDARVNFRDALSSQAVDPEEMEANAFAAELLMPRAFVLSELLKAVDLYKTHDAQILGKAMARTFRVSPKAMDYRLRNLGLIVE